jgi:hypothetical protein
VKSDFQLNKGFLMDQVAYQAIPVDWNDYVPSSTERSSNSDNNRKKLYLLGGLVFVFLLILGIVLPILHHKHEVRTELTESRPWEPPKEVFEWEGMDWWEDDAIYGEVVNEDFEAEEFLISTQDEATEFDDDGHERTFSSHD